MARPRDVIVRFLADTKAFLRSTDEVSDAYDDMGRDAKRLTDIGETEARDLARAYDRAGDKIRRDAKASSKATAKSYGEVGRDAGNEFVAEVGASISSGDLSGLAQGTLGGLATEFGAKGPVGAALAGLGLAGSAAFALIAEKSREAATAAQTAFDEILNKATAEEKLRSRLETYFGTYEAGLAEMDRLAQATGIPIQTIADAFIEGGPAARDLAAETERMSAALGDPKFIAGSRGLRVTPAEVASLEKLAGLMERTAAATERAAAAEDRRAEALRLSALYASQSFYSFTPTGTPLSPNNPRYVPGKR